MAKDGAAVVIDAFLNATLIKGGMMIPKDALKLSAEKA